jgi:putative alpha-1,2-mannosidase
MRKYFLFLAVSALAHTSFAQFVNQVADPVEWVNPLMGTDSKPSLSNGNTYPGIACSMGYEYMGSPNRRYG